MGMMGFTLIYTVLVTVVLVGSYVVMTSFVR